MGVPVFEVIDVFQELLARAAARYEDVGVRARVELDTLFKVAPVYRDSTPARFELQPFHYPEKVKLFINGNLRAAVYCNACGRTWGSDFGSYRVGIEEYIEAHSHRSALKTEGIMMTGYKTDAENRAEALKEARKMTRRQIEEELRYRSAFHHWYVSALEQALKEKIAS